MKFIHVGLGEFGRSWLKEVLPQIAEVEVVGIVDKRPDARTLLDTTVPGYETVPIYSDIDLALDALKVDFVLNSTPPKAHRDVDVACLNRGIPVLSEKPVAETYAQGKEVMELAQRTGVPLMIAENYRFYRIMRKAAELVAQGAIGKLTMINMDFFHRHHMQNYHMELLHPLLLDVSVHHLDSILFIAGAEATKVYARGWTPEGSWYNGYSNIELLFELANGVRVNYRGSLYAFGEYTDWVGDWLIEGDKGYIRMKEGLLSVTTAEGTQEYHLPETHDSRIDVMKEFVSSLREKRPGETAIDVNMRAYKLVQTAAASIEADKPILLKDWE